MFANRFLTMMMRRQQPNAVVGRSLAFLSSRKMSIRMLVATKNNCNASCLSSLACRDHQLATTTMTIRQSYQNQATKRCFSFNFAGPRKLDEILKKELVEDKSTTEIADLWYTYHESKENVHGLVLKGGVTTNLLERAASNPFFVQPVFRDDGYFMMICQFQEPYHFFMAYLEDYKMDPTGAQPLLTFSIFEDYATSKDLVLVRADILNKGLHDDEGYKLVQNMLDMYTNDDEYMIVNAFNRQPNTFDLDDFVSRQNEKWRNHGANTDEDNADAK